MEVGVKEAAEILNVSEKTIYRWISAEKVPYFKIGSQYRFSRSRLNEWLAANSGTLTAVEPEVCERAVFTLSDAVRSGGIYYRIDGNDVGSVISEMVNQAPLPETVNREALTAVLLEREKLGSTGIGDGIAIPHTRTPIIFDLPSPVLTINFLENAIDFSSIDRKPVQIAFLMLSSSSRAHLQLLSRLSFALRRPAFLEFLHTSPSREGIMASLANIDNLLL